MRTVCMICNQKNNRNQLYKLQRILRNFEEHGLTSDHHRLNIFWSGRTQCQYGLFCSTLTQTSNEEKQLEWKIEGYFNPLINSNNTALYHQTLDLLRGDYPNVYRFIEREWQKRHKEVYAV